MKRKRGGDTGRGGRGNGGERKQEGGGHMKIVTFKSKFLHIKGNTLFMTPLCEHTHIQQFLNIEGVSCDLFEDLEDGNRVCHVENTSLIDLQYA